MDGFDLGEEWEGEIRHRVDEIDSGRVQPVSGEGVFERLAQRLRAR